jgi:AcrR family transcriptional regulator
MPNRNHLYLSQKLLILTDRTVGFSMNDTKEHILDVSLTLFLQKSYKAVTMKEIVEKTGLSKGAFYYYFESKEQLFIKAFEHYYGDALRDDLTQISQDSLKSFYNDILVSLSENLKKFLKMEEENGAEPMNHHLLLFEAISRIPSFREMYKKENQKEVNAWKEVIKKARESREIDTELSDEMTVKLFVHAEAGFRMHSFLMGNQNVEALIQEMQSLWDSLYYLLKA